MVIDLIRALLYGKIAVNEAHNRWSDRAIAGVIAWKQSD